MSSAGGDLVASMVCVRTPIELPRASPATQDTPHHQRANPQVTALLHDFAGSLVPDPRARRGRRHDLASVLAVGRIVDPHHNAGPDGGQ